MDAESEPVAARTRRSLSKRKHSSDSEPTAANKRKSNGNTTTESNENLSETNNSQQESISSETIDEENLLSLLNSSSHLTSTSAINISNDLLETSTESLSVDSNGTAYNSVTEEQMQPIEESNEHSSENNSNQEGNISSEATDEENSLSLLNTCLHLSHSLASSIIVPNDSSETSTESGSMVSNGTVDNSGTDEQMQSIEEAENNGTGETLPIDQNEAQQIAQGPKVDAKKIWLFQREFENKAALDEFLKQAGCWALLKKVSLELYYKTQLRCKNNKRRGQQCANGLYYLESKDPEDQTIKLYKRNADHDCAESNNKVKTKVTEETKQFILEQKKRGNKVGAIMLQLQDKPELSTVDAKQVKHVINYYGPKKDLNPFVSISQLEEFAKSHRELPENEDEGFVVHFECSPPLTPDKEKFFRISYSTKRLLKNALMSTTFHADGTYKMMVQGYPVLAGGITDKDRRFHLTIFAITSNETAADFKFLFESLQIGAIMVANTDLSPDTLVADAAAAITNGFAQAFDGLIFNRIHCYAHMMSNVNQQSFNKSEHKVQIQNDLRKMQLLSSPELFAAGWKLFSSKWSKKESAFVKYFQKNHIDMNGNWYEGYADRKPKTNNAVENFNKLLKQEQTFNLRKPLHEFLEAALLIVKQRSTQYVKDKAEPTTIVPVPDELRLDAWNYAISNKSIAHEKSANGELLVYVFAGDKMDAITLKDVQAQKEYKPKNFDDFIQNAFSIYKMVFSDLTANDWINAKCTCASYLKKYMCKHIVAVAYRMKALEPPMSLLKRVETPAPKKNQRGRPRKATKALLRD